ncbi:MAG: 4-(cytidine 5'-diphospho)-2-C-methyl-D-erythritol kinase [Pseudomonadota bacterium]
MTRIDETAYAKINLDLRICHRRPDGYHNLDSIVVFANVGDKLTFTPADDLTLTVDGPFGLDLSSDDDNLVIRAAKALAHLAGREARARIRLEKHLPIAAGIGGGSADAAATLRGLIRLWKLPVTTSDLLPLATSLGADVPVCLKSTAARMQGIGDVLTSLSPPTSLPLVLINAGKAISTPDVFRALGEHSGLRSSKLDDVTRQGFRDHLQSSVNDLESAAIQIEPIIRSVLDVISAEPGCFFARMSGSGATCFGVFDTPGFRDAAVSTLKGRYPSWWVIGVDVR